MIKTHSRNMDAIQVSDEMFDVFFSEAAEVVYRLRPVYKDVSDFLAGEIDDEDLFDVLDELVLKIKNIGVVSECLPSTNDSNNKYLRRTVFALECFVENVKSLTSSGTYPDAQDAGILQEELFSIIGGLAYFLVFDFGIDKLVCDSAAGTKSESIDSVFANYCKAKGVEPLNFGMKMIDIFKEFKFRFDVFDECPELEPEFEKILGPEYNIIPEEILTVELVKSVVSGKLSRQEFLDKYCVEKEDD